MSMLGRAFHTLRVWLGLADASESRITPDYGWLLPVPAEARRQRDESDAYRAARLRARGVQA
jgi:hypothetical protein